MVYIGSGIAFQYHDTNYTIGYRGLLVIASNEYEALGKAKILVENIFPTSKGWVNHNSSVSLLDVDRENNPELCRELSEMLLIS